MHIGGIEHLEWRVAGEASNPVIDGDVVQEELGGAKVLNSCWSFRQAEF